MLEICPLLGAELRTLVDYEGKSKMREMQQTRRDDILKEYDKIKRENPEFNHSKIAKILKIPNSTLHEWMNKSQKSKISILQKNKLIKIK